MKSHFLVILVNLFYVGLGSGQHVLISGLPRGAEKEDGNFNACFKVLDKMISSKKEGAKKNQKEPIFSISAYAGTLLEKSSLFRDNKGFEIRSEAFNFQSYEGWIFEKLDKNFDIAFPNDEIPRITKVRRLSEPFGVALIKLVDSYLKLAGKINFSDRRNAGKQFSEICRSGKLFYVDAPMTQDLWFNLVVEAMFEGDLKEVSELTTELNDHAENCSVLVEGYDFKIITPSNQSSVKHRLFLSIPMSEFSLDKQIVLPKY